MRSPGKVLLIDDDVDDCLIFGLALKEINPKIDFECEQNSELALSKLIAPGLQLPGIIFLDWNMPKLNGQECLKAIRQNPRYDEIPVIIFTTSSAATDKSTAIQLGASYFLSKPSSIADLIKQLELILSFNWHGSAQ